MSAKESNKKNSTEGDSFEDAIGKLSDIVRNLEDGNLTLDESLASYELGIHYLKHCQRILTSAERKIELLSGFDAEGNPVTQRFDDEEMSLQEKAEKRSRRRTARPKNNGSKRAVSEDQSSTDDVDESGTLF